MAGLNPTEIGEIVEVIREVRDGGVTILLIEHVMQAVTSLAERVYVLNQGRMIAEGTPAAIADDPAGHRSLSRPRRRQGAACLRSS